MGKQTDGFRTSKFNAPGELWTVEVKISAIAQMLQAHNPEIQPDEMDFYGLGMIVRDLAAELQGIRNHIEERQPDFGSDPKPKKRNGKTKLRHVSLF